MHTNHQERCDGWAFRPELSSSAPRSDLRSELGQILAITKPRSVCIFRPLAVKAGVMTVDFLTHWAFNLDVQRHFSMQQRSITAYPALKGLSHVRSITILKLFLGALLWHTVQ
jgi:hypothetical protein